MSGLSPIRTSAFARDIGAALSRAGLERAELHIVPSVQEWANARGIPETEPFRAAMAARSVHGTAAVILLECISEDIQESIIPALEIRGFGNETPRLAEPGAFLEHLVLHEIAHIVLPAGATESECDRWAFDRLVGDWVPAAAAIEICRSTV